MKKSLVNYESESEEEPSESLPNPSSNLNQKKRLTYDKLPISNKLNFKESLKSHQESSSSQLQNLSTSSNFQTVPEPRVFNLPEPMNKPQIPHKFEKKADKPARSIFPNSQTISKTERVTIPDSNPNADQEHQENVEEDPIDYFDSQPNFFLSNTAENEDQTQEQESENTEKLLEYLNKRQRGSKKGVNVQEINGKNLLDFDWHGYRERQKIKKETSLQKNFKAPNKNQKTKHQLTYLAYEAITKQEEIDNRKMEARKNHMLTQQKYGW